MSRPAAIAPLLFLLASCAAPVEIKRQPTAPRLSSRASGFPSDDVAVALRAAEGGLRSCSDSAVPRSFEAVLRFEPSGRVGKVDVVPGEGRVVSCIRARLGEVTLRAFDGAPVTVRMAFEL